MQAFLFVSHAAARTIAVLECKVPVVLLRDSDSKGDLSFESQI